MFGCTSGSAVFERKKGRLLGGITGVPPCEVVIIGGGTVGTSAAKIALGMKGNVTLLDIDLERLHYLSEILKGNLSLRVSNAVNIANAVKKADLLIGAVLVAGAKAPRVVTKKMIEEMSCHSVVIDVAVDQGGCVETCHATTHSEPIYYVDGVLHYCVANMPGIVPHTSTRALTNATLPYIEWLANLGIKDACRFNPALKRGVNTYKGKLVCGAVKKALKPLTQ